MIVCNKSNKLFNLCSSIQPQILVLTIILSIFNTLFNT